MRLEQPPHTDIGLIKVEELPYHGEVITLEASGTEWLWSVPMLSKHGYAATKDSAICAAKRAVDYSLFWLCLWCTLKLQRYRADMRHRKKVSQLYRKRD